jgi:catechol 2,3-dioxygenase-like lactoylglutathione lyase family enzyme
MELVFTEFGKQDDGYLKHFFFDIGNGQMLAFFLLDNVGEEADYKTDITVSQGLPVWVNHVAFHAESEDRFQEIKQRCKENGIEFFAEVDHHLAYQIQ